MTRNESLLCRLNEYEPFDRKEEEFIAKFRKFIVQNDNCMDRNLTVGHITGSSWIVDKTYSFTMLTYHNRIKRWFQLGGHCEGEIDLKDVALREALEESGLSSLNLADENVFSVDIHEIPESPVFPKHMHYDMRFLFDADLHVA